MMVELCIRGHGTGVATLWWFHHANRQRNLAEVAVTDSIGNSLPDEGKVAHWAAEKAKCIAFWDEHGVE